jgi:enoyl-CoA hydratase/carnithine racemase
MAYENIIFEKADQIGRITLNRPERLNAFVGTMREPKF